jgi:hypothetical protein
MITYDVGDWYWLVLDNGKTWSSGDIGYIAGNHQGYLDFLARGGTVSIISTEDDLQEVLTDNGLFGPTQAASSEPMLYATRLKALETVKNIRQSYLDLIAKSPGITQAYGMNGRATDLILSGQGATVLFATRTAEIYGANAGANMPQNFTALQWATYIDGERNREFSRGERIESDGYLHYLTMSYMATTIGELQAAQTGYETFCQALMLCAGITEIAAVIRP